MLLLWQKMSAKQTQSNLKVRDEFYPLPNPCLVSGAMPDYSGFVLWDIVSYSCKIKSGIKSYFLSTGFGPTVWEVCLPRKHLYSVPMSWPWQSEILKTNPAVIAPLALVFLLLLPQFKSHIVLAACISSVVRVFMTSECREAKLLGSTECLLLNLAITASADTAGLLSFRGLGEEQNASC